MTDIAWAGLAAYLWITGGLGWAYQHELDRDVILTPLGKGKIVFLFPAFAAVAIGGRVLDAARVAIIYLSASSEE